MNTWNLSLLYSGFDDPKYEGDIKLLSEKSREYNEFAKDCEKENHLDLIKKYIKFSEEMSVLITNLYSFASLSYSANTKDTKAASMIGRLMGILSGNASADAKISRTIADIEDLEDLIKNNEDLSEYAYMLRSIKNHKKYLLGDREEEILARMDISGASAWSDLQGSLTSSVKANYRGKDITLSEVRALAYDKDESVRKDAYEAELKCYDSIKDSVAFALNSITHQVISECQLRGFESPLDRALYSSRMKRETLDALLSAMQDYMPVFRKYLKTKAKALGHDNGLPFYDLFAPMGKSDKTYTIEDAKAYLLDVFSKFDMELHDMIKYAFEHEWIDFYPREGKVGGAFDHGVATIKESRVLTNFTGAFTDIVTLAHELGHAFHDRQVFAHSIITQDYSMPVAETASTFNETLVMETAINAATDKMEKLNLLESRIQDTCQIIVDIYSRFLFEKSVFDNRENAFMDADTLCDLMLKAQDNSYGDGLDPNFKHKFMWLCKGHYYSGNLSFYNFPYAFGGLFARGLYEKYKKEGKDFVKTYKKLLFATSVTDVEDTAKIAGIDLTDKAFWCQGLESCKREIDTFCELVEDLK